MTERTPPEPRRTLVRALSPTVMVALLLAPCPLLAAPPSDTSEQPEPEPNGTLPDVDPEAAPQPTVTAVEAPEIIRGGGVAGAVVDPDDPNATRAQSDLEGESLDTNVAGVPERLPKLQAGGWWMTFGAVALAASGGVLSGIAETREDEAERLAYGFDLSTGSAPLYADVADEYERTLQEGNSYQRAARGLVIAGSATLLVGIGLFIADGVQRRRRRSDTHDASRLDASRRSRFVIEANASGLSLRF